MSALRKSCINACILFLTTVKDQHVVLIDDRDEIRTEYAQVLEMGRPYQLGAQFLIHILRHQHNPAHVRQLPLNKSPAGDYIDFPSVPELEAFDVSDRKFAVLALVSGAAVTNAVDSDWADHLLALSANGIAVDFLCGCDPALWFAS